jgi:polyketide synthase PksN
MGGRFPGASNLLEFWTNLLEGKSAITEMPTARRKTAIEGVVHSSVAESMKFWGGFVQDVDCFDALFFGISPKEAELMDPQQRLLLEVVWQTLEDARIKPSATAGTQTGVFIGACNVDYSELLGEDHSQSGLFATTGSFSSILSNRVSYAFDWCGPSVTVDTACSSSLVAVHFAVQAIKNGECKLAVAGGVNICWTAKRFLAFSRAGMLAKDGRCKTFDAKADGYVRGEGIGAILLKPLNDAVRDGNHIHGVIRASAINHGGKTRGLTVTSPAKQSKLIVDAYRRAGIHPERVGYIETHGTGTALGDPIEFLGLKMGFEALVKLFGCGGTSSNYCALGSVKTNIGHLEAAAGVAGLVKVLLALKHKIIPASLNVEKLNPLMVIEGSPFYIQTQSKYWEPHVGDEGPLPRVAGVSSFGFGGAYAHVVVEAYEKLGDFSAQRAQIKQLAVLSARNVKSLHACMVAMIEYLQARSREKPVSLSELAYSLHTTREEFAERVAFIVSDTGNLIEKLRAVVNGDEKIGDCFLGKAEKYKMTVEDESVVEEHLGKRELGSLAALWVRGWRVNWKSLYADQSLSTIPLPMYPFAKERYWIESASLARLSDGRRGSDREDGVAESWDGEEAIGGAEEGIERALYIEEWQPSELESVGQSSGSCRIVVFLSELKRQTELAARMAQVNAQAQVVCVAQSASVGQVEAGYAIDREVAGSYADTIRRIVEEKGEIDAVWYLWGLEDLSCIQDQGPIIRLVQGLASAQVRPVKVFLAGEYESARERCYLESWIGFERSLKQVLPEMHCAVIQAEVPKEARSGAGAAREGVSSVAMGEWTRRLWNETQVEKSESVLYGTGEQRHRLRLRRVDVDRGGISGLQQGGTYLITGGMGGLGYVFAEYLAQRYAARLVLIGRSSLDASKAAKLEALRELGGEAIYVAADVSNVEQMRAARECGRERWGELQGVIHAAGIPGQESVLSQEVAGFEAVLAAKIAGTEVLDELCADGAVEFVCYFSSSSAFLGDSGSCDYSIGNRFELAYAKYVNRRAVAICWPLWAAGGMTFGDAEATKLYLLSSGQRALEASEGLEVFEQILRLHQQGGFSHALVMNGQKSRVERMLGIAASVPMNWLRETRAGQEQYRAELRGLTLSQRVEWELKEFVSELLKLPREKLDAEENLAEFGFDSIGLAQLAKRLSKRYSITITPAIFFSHSSLSKLVEYLVGEHTGVMQQCYAEPGEGGAGSRGERKGGEGGARARERRLGQRSDVEVRRVEPGSEGMEPIAIIGMSGRFAGARNVEELWQLMVAGKAAVEEIPLTRFDWRGYYQAPEEDRTAPSAGKTQSKWLGVLPGVDEFDPLFFEIAPKEAELMDPRQRLLLQESFKALEDAGYGSSQLSAHKIGMFVGVEQGDYQLLAGELGGITSNHDGILAARLSYCLNLRGPALAINTACSSGLVAAHQACQSLRSGECDTALAAAVNLILTPHNYIGMSQVGMLSPDGKCYAFDQRANGMVPGEAVVCVVLKRLSQAQAEGDAIQAVIRGSSINYDGKTNGLTAPSGAAQVELIRDTYLRAQVDPQAIEHIVTHGTGTRLGDPVEIQALREAFREVQSAEPYCALTSIKTNVGHTFAASGLVSLVSLVQGMRNETIPASLNCEQLSDYIDWQQSPFYVSAQTRPWPKQANRSRFGAVSAFGMSGTNAHMVVESYDQEGVAGTPGAGSMPCYLVVLSAKTETALLQRARDLIDVLKDERRDWSGAAVASLSYTLLMRRQHYAHRCALVVKDCAQAMALLEKVAGQEKLPTLLRGKVARDFSEQPLLREYADGLLGKLAALQDDPLRYQQSLTALADLYCHGYSLNWSSLYHHPPHSPLSLPTYPFAQDRYWVDLSGKVTNDVLSIENTNVDSESDVVYRRPELQELTLDQCVLWELQEITSELLKLPREKLDADGSLAEFGFDSIGLTTLARRLSAHFGVQVLPSVFFTHATLTKLKGYFVTRHVTLMRKRYGDHDGARTRSVENRSLTSKSREHTQPSGEALAMSSEQSVAASGNEIFDPIAIIGLSGRFPCARNVEELWQILVEGREAVQEIPQTRFDWRDCYLEQVSEQFRNSQSTRKTNSKWLGVLPGVDEFDALFFEIAPKDAQSMDPRQRLLLQESFKALEDAGYGDAQLRSQKIGMFVGVEQGDYQLLVGEEGSVTANHDAILAARLSYFLDLRGPTMAINTACSSGLVALHQACMSLLARECDTAIAAGVNLILTPHNYVAMSQAGMLSPDGKCYAFDRRANGMVPGEAVIAVVLKRLSLAEAAGDSTYAVIRSTGINFDGKTNGITAPNGAAQTELLKNTYERGRIDVDDIEYIVTHGTGTRLGDPVEVTALQDAFQDARREPHFCALTSPKTNFGHTFAASGLLSLVSLVQALLHETIPASLHCEELSDYIDWNQSPLYVNKQNKAWPKTLQKRRFGAVSAFGMSGTNAHVVVADFEPAAPVTMRDSPDLPCYLLAISAKSETALQQRVCDLVAMLKDKQKSWYGPAMSALSYTLLNHRQHFTYRCAVVVDDSEHAITLLEKVNTGEQFATIFRGKTAYSSPEQSALRRRADDLLERLAQMQADPKSYQESLAALGDFYCQGYRLDWRLMYGDRPQNRIRLPTYPFSREQYWIERSDTSYTERAKVEYAEQQQLESSRSANRWLKVAECWTPSPFRKTDQAWLGIAQSKGAQRVLVVYRQPSDAEFLSKALGQIWGTGADKLLVKTLRLPDLSAPEESCPLEEYLAKHRHPDAIFYFSGVIEKACLMRRELHSIIRASQILMGREGNDAVQFLYCYPAAATCVTLYQQGLSGLFRAIAVERPQHCYRSLEYPIFASLEDHIAIVREWLQHTVTDWVPAQIPMVRHREGSRHITGLRELTSVKSTNRPVQFRRGATYLMVGGLGEVGRVICRALAQRYQPRLVILSRSVLDADIRQRIASIVEAGAEVVYRSVDITDECLLMDVLGGIKTEIGPIHGVFQFARSISDGPLQSMSFASFQQAIAAKVEGTLNVDVATANEPLDFFIVYSSMASFGIEGSAGYGYATSFQNSFVRDRNDRVARGERAGRSVALCWGQWEVDAYLSAQRAATMKQQGFDFIDSTAAVSLMEEGLHDRDEVVGIIAVNDIENVKRLYGLSEPRARSIPSLKKGPERKPKTTTSLKDILLELNRKENESFDAAIQVLSNQSLSDLVGIYDALKD